MKPERLIIKPWSRVTRILVILAGAIGLVWLLIAINPLLQSLLAAALIAYLLYPLVEYLTRRTRLDRLWAARLVYGLLLLLFIGLPALLSTFAFSQYDRFEDDFLAAIAELNQWFTHPIEVFGFRFQPLALLDVAIQNAGNALSEVPGGVLAALLGASTDLLWGLTIVVSLYYFLVDGYRLKPWLVGLLPEVYQPEANLLLTEIDEVWRLFLRAQLIIFAIFLFLLGGGILSVVWLYRIQLLPLSPIGLALALIVVYIIVQNIDNIVVRPYFFGESLQLHPGVVFVGLIAGLAYGGLLGVIIVTPLIATAKILGRYLHRRLLGLPLWPALEQIEIDGEESKS